MSPTERRALLLLGLLTLGLCLLPIWVSPALPLLDEPNHLGALTIWRGLADGDPSITPYYSLALWPAPYLLHYGLAFALSGAFGVLLAHKLALSVFALALPLAALLFTQQSGRSPYLALLTAPLYLSLSWAHGFHPFNAGLAMCLLGLVAFDRLLLGPSPARYAAVTLCAFACYFGHPVPMALLCAGALPLLAIHRVGWRRSLAALATLAPSVALLLWQSLRVSDGGPSALRALGPSFPVRSPATWLARLRDLPEHALNPLAAAWDSQLLALALLLALGACLLGARAVAGRRALYHRGLLLALFFFALYLVLPEHLDPPVYMWIARGRLAPLVAFFVLLSPPLGPRARARFLVIPVALALLLVPVESARVYAAYAAQVDALEARLEACPADAQLLTIRVGDQREEGLELPIYRQLPSLVQALRGGFSPDYFERERPFLFSVDRRLPSPHWRQHERYAPSLDPAVYGCVLTHRLARPLPARQWKLASEQGDFRLYLATRAR